MVRRIAILNKSTAINNDIANKIAIVCNLQISRSCLDQNNYDIK